MSSAANLFLEQLNQALQNEVNVKIKKAIDLFVRCDDQMKMIVIHETGFSGELNGRTLRQHFDTLDLMDELDICIQNMEEDLE